MGKLTGLLLLLAALSVAPTEGEEIPVYFTDGGDLTLKLRPAPSKSIINILWKFNGNLLAEWTKDKVPLFYYGSFADRSTLNTDTGELKITKMTKEHEGVYSVVINDKIQSDEYRAKMIKKVTKPEVVVRTLTCTHESESCNMSCVAETTGAEPVQYRWSVGPEGWKKSEKNTITKASDSQVETITCWIKNPVSEEVKSDPIDNPLYDPPPPLQTSPTGAIVVGLLGALAVLCAIGGLIFAWKKKIGPFKNRANNTGPVNGNVPAAPPDENPTLPAEMKPLKDKPNSDVNETP